MISKSVTELDIVLEKWMRKSLTKKQLNQEMRLKILEREYEMPSKFILNQKEQDIDSEEKPFLSTENDSSLNYIQKNKVNLRNPKTLLLELKKRNKEIFVHNIQKYCFEKNFSRRELHSCYIMYKTLQEVTSQKYKNYS